MDKPEPFYSPNRQLSPRQPQRGEHVWGIRKPDGRQLDSGLCDHSAYGWEVLFYHELEFPYGRQWPSREQAQRDAAQLCEHFVSEGGVVISGENEHADTPSGSETPSDG